MVCLLEIVEEYFVNRISLHFPLGILKGECRPFIVDGKQVGLIRPEVVAKLLNYPEVFIFRESDLDGRVSSCQNNTKKHLKKQFKNAINMDWSILSQKGIIELNPAFRDYDERTHRVEEILREFRANDVFVTLRGWRDEVS